MDRADTTTPHGGAPTLDAIAFLTLREANVARQAAWCPDQVPDLSFRGNELGGEVGEALNVIKKLERERHGWRGSRDTVAHLAEELADVVICADLVAITAGIDLDEAVTAKFNATSEKVGLPHRLDPAALSRLSGPAADAAGLVDAVRGWRCGLCGCANSLDTGVCTGCNTSEMWCQATPLDAAFSTLPGAAGGDGVPTVGLVDTIVAALGTHSTPTFGAGGVHGGQRGFVVYEDQVRFVAAKIAEAADPVLKARRDAIREQFGPTPAVGGVALPGVEEIAEALYVTSYEGTPPEEGMWQALDSSEPDNVYHRPCMEIVARYRAHATALRAHLDDRQARPAAPEGADGRLRAAVRIIDDEIERVSMHSQSFKALHRVREAVLASSAPAGGVELQSTPLPTAPVDGVRKLALFLLDRLAEFDSGDLTEDGFREFNGHVTPAAARLRAALDAGDGGAAAGDKVALDARRYRWLRSRDVDTIRQGGVFAGQTPENLVLSEEHLDAAIDAAMAARALQPVGARS
jgi:NTP pyrophosphatase (non-canonical NTP hydrolase)